MANKKIKGKKWLHKTAPLSFQMTTLATKTPDKSLSESSHEIEKSGWETEGSFKEGPSMGEILASLEGVLDEKNAESYENDSATNKKSGRSEGDDTFELASLKGFENDSNLEQEIIETLEASAHEEGISLGEEDDYINFGNLSLDDKGPLADEEEEKPLDLAGMEIVEHAHEKSLGPESENKSELALEQEQESDRVSGTGLEPLSEASPEKETEPGPEIAPEIETELDREVISEVETKSGADICPSHETELGPKPEPGSEHPSDQPIEPRSEMGLGLEHRGLESEVKPEQKNTVEVKAESEQLLRLSPQWTPEMLRNVYGERVDVIIKEMAQEVLREILPGILEKVIREELERIISE